ncbi:acyl-CoA thioesterase [Gallaecimonas xiamenensis]|uniref:4-hydroxybenzoyl-CoA thioesterase domain-containing protein n=1 Tax=Gallaecimonas xiamenensis 3-C-1 TaxID=745411 RepID=K2JPS3_9GAMM|nr:4-hydroxybenzoyl-CoA thioesterase domain-containing protein [Gallaecimonas xiamenensis 3-C-1]
MLVWAIPHSPKTAMASPLPWDHPQPFVQALTVLPEHIDELGHTNNAVYVRWCGDIAWAHTTALGLGLDLYRELDRAMAMQQAQYQYLAAALAGDELLLGTWVEHCDGKLVSDRLFQLLRPADGKTLFRGKVRFVCIEMSSGKPKRMPAAFADGYRGAALDV